MNGIIYEKKRNKMNVEKKWKINKRRKRQIEDVLDSEHCSERSSKRKNLVETNEKSNLGKPLSGLTFCVSTNGAGNKNVKSSDSDVEEANRKQINDGQCLSYKEVCDLVLDLGGTYIPQVGKRIFAVLANRTSLNTQKVRKALKRNALILDIDWLLKCKTKQSKVCCKEFSLVELAKSQKNSKQQSTCVLVDSKKSDDDEENLDLNTGWSKPISLDCCCMCHDEEKDDNNCPWCCEEGKECNIILALRRKSLKD